MKKKYLSICIGILILLSLCTCKNLDKSLYPWKYAPTSPANQPIPPKDPLPIVTNINVKDEKEAKEFLAFKKSGMQAMQENRLTMAINLFTKALAIHQSEEINGYLQECYYERGEYYYSLGKWEEAFRDLMKSETEASKQLQRKIIGNGQPKLVSPPNESIIRVEILSFSWEAVRLADYYIIQLLDESLQVVSTQKATKNEWQSSMELAMNKTYYWSVRAHLLNDTWGLWSEQWKVVFRSAEYEREQFIAACQPYTYQQLTEISGVIKGKKVVLIGQLIEVMETSNNTVDMLVNITLKGTTFTDTVLVQFTRLVNDKTALIEGDIVTLWGTYQGLVTYQSIFEESRILPNIITQYISVQTKKAYLKKQGVTHP